MSQVQRWAGEQGRRRNVPSRKLRFEEAFLPSDLPPLISMKLSIRQPRTLSVPLAAWGPDGP